MRKAKLCTLMEWTKQYYDSVNCLANLKYFVLLTHSVGASLDDLAAVIETERFYTN